MKAKILIVSLSLLVMAACSKDKYNTIPTLTFESVNATTFPSNASLLFKLLVTDKEGDINTDNSGNNPAFDTIWYEKISYSCGEDGHILFAKTIPPFTATPDVKAHIDISLVYGQSNTPTQSSLSGCLNKDDSCYFRFWLHDRAGHVSDTVKSPTIKLLKG